MQCKKCNGILTIEEKVYKKYQYCLLCYDTFEDIDYYPSCCKNPKLIKVRHKLSNDTYNVRDQCQTCGKIHTKSYSHKTYDPDSLPDSDVNFYDESINKKNEEYQSMKDWFFKDKTLHYSIETNYPGYLEYLKSEEWKNKRDIVFKRDNNICQSCLNNSADQVHHLTYRHIFNEPLFDLISICFDCHKIITDIDKGVDNVEKIKHKI